MCNKLWFYRFYHVLFSNVVKCYRLKLHEDWGTSPAAIDTCLRVAEKYNVQVRSKHRWRVLFVCSYFFVLFYIVRGLFVCCLFCSYCFIFVCWRNELCLSSSLVGHLSIADLTGKTLTWHCSTTPFASFLAIKLQKIIKIITLQISPKIQRRRALLSELWSKFDVISSSSRFSSVLVSVCVDGDPTLIKHWSLFEVIRKRN